MSRILIVEDDEPMRYLICRLLQGHEVVGEVPSGEEAVRAVETVCPDVVLLDVSLPGMNGFDVGRILRRRCPDARLVFVTMYADPAYVEEAFSVGAHGYVVKRGAPVELPAAVQAAVAGKYYRSPLVDAA
jgi:DNA-binding NarL/FixJ family response regulator